MVVAIEAPAHHDYRLSCFQGYIISRSALYCNQSSEPKALIGCNNVEPRCTNILISTFLSQLGSNMSAHSIIIQQDDARGHNLQKLR